MLDKLPAVPRLTDMWVGEIDVHDDNAVRKFWEAGKEGDAFERPYAAYWSLQAAKVSFRIKNNPMEQHALVAREGDDVLGISQVILPVLDNTHLAYAEPVVRPAFRRQGIGSALLDESQALVRECGRDMVIVEVNLSLDGAGPGRDFLGHRGFSVASLEIHRVLELPVASSRLEELAADCPRQ